MALKISSAEASMLKQLQKENTWDIVIKLLAQKIDEIRAEDANGPGAFETLRSLHTNQGKVAGLKEFFDDLERGAFE